MMRRDNVEAGVVLTTTTMTTTAMTTTTGIAAEMPDGVPDELKALLKKDEAGFAPVGGRGAPLVGIGVGLGRGGDGGRRWGGIDAGRPRRAYDDSPRTWIDAYGP
jgi:hypothetical protein